MKSKEEIRRVNKEVARRFNELENELPTVSDITGLFEVLFAHMENQFEIPFVWLTLIDTEANRKIIDAVKKSVILHDRLSLIKRELLAKIFSAGAAPLLANNSLRQYYKLLPSRKKYFIKSLALVPLYVKGQLVGSWNNGDSSAERFSPEMETSLLQKFAGNVSLRLAELLEA
ncbi:MAG TPA: hypothetical protein ENN23_09615 [Deltaproteobacteria bacterium]|nr:hypothetical protein [Deltaproteobacteria bacterium]